MGNDPLFLNKIAAAVIAALLLGMTAAFITGFIYKPKMLEKHVYAIDGGAVAAATPAADDKAPAGPDPIAPLLANADIASGKKISGKCSACHTFEKGGQKRIGPNLWDTVGAKQAGHSDFSYSSAFKKLSGEWTYEELNKFLYKPRDYARGTKMSFVGLRKPEERADMIVYLRSLSDNPKPLP